MLMLLGGRGAQERGVVGPGGVGGLSVLVIEGARQVGKSTLVSMLGDEDTTYVTMDDDVVRGFAQRDPVGLLRSGGGRLVIDEIQRCPELILPLKMEVDRDRRPGRFVLTGSANLLRVPGAEDSLAGRAMTIRLHPFSQGELAGRVDDWVADVVDGAGRGRGWVGPGAASARTSSTGWCAAAIRRCRGCRTGCGRAGSATTSIVCSNGTRRTSGVPRWPCCAAW